MQIVAVTFMGWDNVLNKLVLKSETPYFYLDGFYLEVNDYALVFSDKFGLVKVQRIIPISHTEALSKVTKPIIAKVRIDEISIQETASKLKDFTEQTVQNRINMNIDKQLLSPMNNELKRYQLTNAIPPEAPKYSSDYIKELDDDKYQS